MNDILIAIAIALAVTIWLAYIIGSSLKGMGDDE